MRFGFHTLDIIHRRAFYLESDVSETGFCLRLQVEPTKLSPIIGSLPPPLSLIPVSVSAEETD
jgi:hypothetical protein